MASAFRVFLLLALAFAALLVSPAAARAEPGQASVEAVYVINFAGINLGKIKFSTKVGGGSYAVQGAGRLEFLSGILWEVKGASASSGFMTTNGPRPAAFSFRFENGKRRGKLDMTFEKDAVRDIVSDLPDIAGQPRYIPVTRSDLNGVLDPLSAFFLAANSDGKEIDASICDQRVPVFDGQHRFDLQLRHKRTVRVQKQKKSEAGYGGMAVICQVKYVPISGYKSDQEGLEYLARSDAIEVWLIPAPGAGVYVPYHVSVPTLFGPATATSVVVQVKSEGTTRTLLRD